MKCFISIVCITAGFFPLLANAGFGSETGNGGGAVVCRNDQRVIEKVDVLDLYEGFALYGRGYREFALPAEEQAQKFIPTLDAILGTGSPGRTLAPQLESIIARLRPLPAGVGLKPTEDWGNFIVPKDCAIEQAVNYREDGEIFADSEIWRRYSPTQQAAAYIHELLYEYARLNGEEDNSFRVRTLVSLLFADVRVNSVLPPELALSSKREICTAGDSVFYTSPFPTGGLGLYFTKLEGRAALSRIAAVAPDESWPISVSAVPIKFSVPVVSAVDRGMVVSVLFSGGEGELTVRLGSLVSTNKLNCHLQQQ